MRLTGRIRIYAAIVVVLLAFYSIGAVFLVQQLTSSTQQVLEVDEPLEDSVAEMKLSVANTAVAVLSYLGTQEQAELTRLASSETAFRQHAAEFMELVDSDSAQSAGQTAELLYNDLKTLGDELIVDSDRLIDSYREFAQQVQQADAQIENLLQSSLDESSDGTAVKLEAILGMERSLQMAFGAVSLVLVDPAQNDPQAIEDSEANFEESSALYRSAPLTATEQSRLEQIEQGFVAITETAEGIVVLSNEIRQETALFSASQLGLTQFLHEELEVPIRLRTEDAAADTQRSADIAVGFVVVTGLVLIAAVVAVAVAFSRAENRRIKAEKASRRSEENFLTTLDSISDGVIATDTQGAVTRMNPIAESLTGWSIEEARGRPIEEVFDCFSAQANESAAELLKHALERGAIVGLPTDAVLTTRDGSRLQVADSAAPVLDADGTAEGVVMVFRDVTEEFRTETQVRHQHKLESIGTLAGGVAHEINNPLYGIMNYAKLIDDRLEPESPLHEYAQEIGIESERVSSIVRSLLTFSRHDKESHSPARMQDIVDGTLSLIRTIIRRDQITLNVDVPDDLPMLKCRSQQVQQVIMNLLTNGRDALNERYPEHDPNKILSLTVTQFNEGGRRWLRTTVEDHGAGIDPEVVERLFDPFFTTKDRTKGTGLGLSISHGIALSHHGKLWLESEPNQYTRFHLDLPVDNGWKV